MIARDPPLLHVGLAAWIVQDGNYDDFALGDEARFALEFWAPRGLCPAPPGPLTAERLAGSRYRIRARVVAVFYFESLHGLPGIPPLTYRWRIREILRETTPWVDRADAAGRRWRDRDEAREGFVPVAATDAWHEDAGNASYVLGCERIGDPGLP